MQVPRARRSRCSCWWRCLAASPSRSRSAGCRTVSIGRLVLAALGLGFAGLAVILVHLPRSLALVLPPAALLGGFMSTLYPVCVSHAHDRMPADRVVAVSGRLILLSGLGSVVGPLIGASLMAHFTIDGVFYFMAAAALLLAFLAAGRSFTTMAPHHAERPFEILAPQAATLAHAPLDVSPLSPVPVKVASEDS